MTRAYPSEYSQAIVSGIPRLLGLQDRLPYSPSYGSFHRSFWLHRTSDFPSAVAQLGTHSLALLWKHPFEGNIAYGQPKILDWALAGMEYGCSIQKRDGTFDEWYANERGWAGPTAYIVHALADTYQLLGDRVPEPLGAKVRGALSLSGRFLAENDEGHVLANHHAIALLAAYEAFLITGDHAIERGFHRAFRKFTRYCDDEGWSLEYDGADPGYLSATLSFLARLHRVFPSPEIERIVSDGLGFLSYHAFPDGSFAGSLGSRHTSNFFHFGFEYWAKTYPMAARLAQFGLESLGRGKVIAPGAQEDHYFLYRLPELLEGMLAWCERPSSLPQLGFERGPFEKTFERAGFYFRKSECQYWAVGLRRGGVIRGYSLDEGEALIHADSGWLAKLSDGRLVSSQWNDPRYLVTREPGRIQVSGDGHQVTTRLFSPAKGIIFRVAMVLCGWNFKLARIAKIVIRRLLMVGAKSAPIGFTRSIEFLEGGGVEISDTIVLKRRIRLEGLLLGGDFATRFVPQSRYFSVSELNPDVQVQVPAAELERLNSTRKMRWHRRIAARPGAERGR